MQTILSFWFRFLAQFQWISVWNIFILSFNSFWFQSIGECVLTEARNSFQLEKVFETNQENKHIFSDYKLKISIVSLDLFYFHSSNHRKKNSISACLNDRVYEKLFLATCAQNDHYFQFSNRPKTSFNIQCVWTHKVRIQWFFYFIMPGSTFFLCFLYLSRAFFSQFRLKSAQRK